MITTSPKRFTEIDQDLFRIVIIIIYPEWLILLY